MSLVRTNLSPIEAENQLANLMHARRIVEIEDELDYDQQCQPLDQAIYEATLELNRARRAVNGG